MEFFGGYQPNLKTFDNLTLKSNLRMDLVWNDVLAADHNGRLSEVLAAYDKSISTEKVIQ